MSNSNDENENKVYKAKKKLRTNWIYETYMLPNPKTGESIKTEALIEHDFVLKAFFTPSILYISTDIASINSESQQRRYTGDIKIFQEAEGLEYIDCKDQKSMLRQKNIDKFDGLGKEFEDAGSKLKVVTDDQIRSGYLIANYKKFYIYLSMPRPIESNIDAIIDCADNHIKITLGELRSFMSEKGINMRTIWYCLAHQIIHVNLEKYITSKSIVWSKNHAV
jgi:hypothetical protein